MKSFSFYFYRHKNQFEMVENLPFPPGIGICCCCVVEPGTGCSVLPLGSWFWSDAWEVLAFPEDRCWTLAKTGYRIPIEPRDESVLRPTEAGTAATTVLRGIALSCGSLLRELGSTVAPSCWPELALLDDGVPVCPWDGEAVGSLRGNNDPDYGNKRKRKKITILKSPRLKHQTSA